MSRGWRISGGYQRKAYLYRVSQDDPLKEDWDVSSSVVVVGIAESDVASLGRKSWSTSTWIEKASTNKVERMEKYNSDLMICRLGEQAL